MNDQNAFRTTCGLEPSVARCGGCADVSRCARSIEQQTYDSDRVEALEQGDPMTTKSEERCAVCVKAGGGHFAGCPATRLRWAYRIKVQVQGPAGHTWDAMLTTNRRIDHTKVSDELGRLLSDFVTRAAPGCPTCGGTGEDDGERCPTCGGEG